MILTVRAKVLLSSEEQMEVEGSYDLGSIDNKRWTWRRKAILAEEVKEITEYNKSKCLVELFDERTIMVEELFDDLIERWKLARIEVLKITTEAEEEEEEEEEEQNGTKGEED